VPTNELEEHFPYQESTWGQGDDLRRWYEALERTGPENVRPRIADKSSHASVAIGTEISMTVGFAQEWLAWHDRQKIRREAEFRSNQIFWTRWAAIAASVAALAALFGWFLTVLQKW
jgi:hypothetical protein